MFDLKIKVSHSDLIRCSSVTVDHLPIFQDPLPFFFWIKN